MSQRIDHYATRQGTHHGEIKFGHIHDDNNQSACMIRSGPDGGRHYINMEFTGDKASGRRGSTTIKCPGTFNVLAGQDVSREMMGIFCEAEGGDIRIRAPKGRIVLEAENIDLIANGTGDKKGVISIDADEKVVVTAPHINIDSKVSTKIFSEKTVECAGKAVLNIFGGLIDMADGCTTNFGSKFGPTPGKEFTNEVRNRV